MRYRSLNVLNYKKILEMFFLGPRRIPSHKVHSHGSNGSRKERKMGCFFSLLSVVLVAVLSLFHFPLFSCLLSCITPGTLFFLSVLGQLPIITKSLVSKSQFLPQSARTVCHFTSTVWCLFSEGLFCEGHSVTKGGVCRACLKAHSLLQLVQKTNCFPW